MTLTLSLVFLGLFSILLFRNLRNLLYLIWEYAGVYADADYTGTKDSRPEFQRLLADCRAGKIDRVLTKSLSRFARNTVTLLEIVREMKALGVAIVFEKEDMRTAQNPHKSRGFGRFYY